MCKCWHICKVAGILWVSTPWVLGFVSDFLGCSELLRNHLIISELAFNRQFWRCVLSRTKYSLLLSEYVTQCPGITHFHSLAGGSRHHFWLCSLICSDGSFLASEFPHTHSVISTLLNTQGEPSVLLWGSLSPLQHSVLRSLPTSVSPDSVMSPQLRSFLGSTWDSPCALQPGNFFWAVMGWPQGSHHFFPVLGGSLSFITHPVSRVLLGYFGCFRQENKSDPCYFIFGRSTCLSIRFCCITKLHPKCSGLTIFFFSHIGQVGILGQVVLLVLAGLIPGSAVSDEPAGVSASWAFAGCWLEWGRQLGHVSLLI